MLKGFICPNKQKVSFADCTSKCTKRCLPLPFLAGIIKGSMSRNLKGFSVTQITGCLRKTFFEKKQDWWTSPSRNLFFAYRGTVMHNILSNFESTLEYLRLPYKNGYVVEKRFSKAFNCNGRLASISGQIDLYDPHTATLYDYKTISDFVKDLPRPQHITQTNIYSWLLPYEVKRIVLIYMSMNSVKQIEVSILPKTDICSYVSSRISILSRALSTNIPPSEEENGICKYCAFHPWCRKI